MQIAFVHCRVMPGGALSVLKELIDEEKNLKQSTLFTLFADSTSIQTRKHKIPVVTALPRWINQLFLFCSTHHIFLLSRLLDYRNLMFFYPFLMRILSRKIKRYSPDRIIISSFAIAKNITPVSGVPMTLYLHSPMQYIWSHYEEYKSKLRGIKGRLFRRVARKLRKRDLQYSKFDTIYANSPYTADLAKKLYAMPHITIRYPAIDQAFFDAPVIDEQLPYVVYVGRLVNFVREADLIIRLFNELGLPLIMMGSGPDEAYLRSIAKSNIIFVGWIKDVQEKIQIIGQARGLINLTKESFGIGTAEALLLGVPVFGFAGGATPSLVHEDCGYLTSTKSVPQLKKEFTHFLEKKWNRKQIALHARRKLRGGK